MWICVLLREHQVKQEGFQIRKTGEIKRIKELIKNQELVFYLSIVIPKLQRHELFCIVLKNPLSWNSKLRHFIRIIIKFYNQNIIKLAFYNHINRSER